VGGSETSNSGDGDQRLDAEENELRPQRGGEAETTRLGMEEGDNTDIPAAGEGSPVDDADTLSKLASAAGDCSSAML
jgi:hypothetical protein